MNLDSLSGQSQNSHANTVNDTHCSSRYLDNINGEMDNLDFVVDGLKQDSFLPETPLATLSVLFADGSFVLIEGLSLRTIRRNCPLLALSFEEGRSGPRHHVEDSTPQAVASLLRYAYTGHYIPPALQDHRISLLLHVHVYHLSRVYDISELGTQVHASIIKEFGMARSEASSPTDLVKAIQFVYDSLADLKQIADTMCHYLVSHFLVYELGDDPGFKRLAYECRPFHQDLCKTNMIRGFKDEAAMAIVQLPVKPQETDDSVSSRALGDFLYELWNDPIYDDAAFRSSGQETHQGHHSTKGQEQMELPFRPTQLEDAASYDDMPFELLCNNPPGAADFRLKALPTRPARLFGKGGVSWGQETFSFKTTRFGKSPETGLQRTGHCGLLPARASAEAIDGTDDKDMANVDLMQEEVSEPSRDSLPEADCARSPSTASDDFVMVEAFDMSEGNSPFNANIGTNGQSHSGNSEDDFVLVDAGSESDHELF